MGSVLLALQVLDGSCGSAGGFIFLVIGIAIGTAAIAAIGLMSAAVLDGMRDSARDSIGGDVSLRLYHRPPPQAHLQAFRKAGALDRDRTADIGDPGQSFDAGGTESDRRQLPAHGALKLAPPLATGDALASRNGIWGAVVAKSLLTALDAAIGDVSLSATVVRIAGVNRGRADRSLRAFTLGPHVIVAGLLSTAAISSPRALGILAAADCVCATALTPMTGSPRSSAQRRTPDTGS